MNSKLTILKCKICKLIAVATQNSVWLCVLAESFLLMFLKIGTASNIPSKVLLVINYKYSENVKVTSKEYAVQLFWKVSITRNTKK